MTPAVALCVLAAQLPADPAAVAGWVAQLGEPGFPARAAAARRLAAADPRIAQPLVFAASADPDLERAKRAADLLPGLTRRLLTRVALDGPACALDLDDRPLAEALAAVRAQTGLSVGVQPPALLAARVTVRTPGAVPTWAAVHAVAAAAGLEVDEDRFWFNRPVRPAAGGAGVVAVSVYPPPATCTGQADDPPPAPDAEFGRTERIALTAAFAEVWRIANTPQPDLRRQPKEHFAWQQTKWAADSRLSNARYALDAVRPRGRVGASADALVLRPAAAPWAASASGGFRVRAVPLPPELAASVPAGEGAVLLRLSESSLAGWRVSGYRADARVTAAVAADGRAFAAAPPDPDGRRFRLTNVLVEPAGDLTMAVGFDERPRLTPAGATVAPFRTGVRDALARVRLPAPADRLADLRGTLTVELPAEAEVRLDDAKPRPERAGPLPVGLTVPAWRPLIGGGYRLTVEARYPLAVRPRMMAARSAARGLTRWAPLLDGPVRVTVPDRFGFQVALDGKPGATAGLSGGGSRFNTLFGVSAGDGRVGEYDLTLETLRVAVGADAVVTQTLTVVARKPAPPPPRDTANLPEFLKKQMADIERQMGERPPVGPLARVRFRGGVPAELPFHLTDVPLLAGAGPAE